MQVIEWLLEIKKRKKHQQVTDKPPLMASAVTSTKNEKRAKRNIAVGMVKNQTSP